jgi:hypothetical protein
MSACAKSPDRRAQRRQVLHACARQRAAERSAAPKGRREARPAIQEIAMSARAKSSIAARPRSGRLQRAERAAERSAAPQGRPEARPAIQEIAMSACAKSPDRRAQRRQVLHACARQRAAERSAAPHGRREARPAIQGLS